MIDQRDAGEIKNKQMIQRLGAIVYTEEYVPDVNGVATDAYVRGSRDDIEHAFFQGRLTFEEYSILSPETSFAG